MFLNVKTLHGRAAERQGDEGGTRAPSVECQDFREDARPMCAYGPSYQ